MKPPNLKTLPDGTLLRSTNQEPEASWLLVKGDVRLTRTVEDCTITYALLGKGDIVSPDLLFGRRALDHSAVTLGTVEAYRLEAGGYRELLEQAPVWMQPWMETTLRRQPNLNRPGGASLPTLYGICDIVDLVARARGGKDSSKSVQIPLTSLVDELRKAKPFSGGLASTVLSALSAGGLVDLHEGNPSSPELLIPQRDLFDGFLGFLQHCADLPAGIRQGDIHGLLRTSPAISPDGEALMDALLSRDDMLRRLFDPDRAVVHLDLAALAELVEESLDPGRIEDGLAELEAHGCATPIQDHDQRSVVLNLREMLRFNLRRDPVTGFTDLAAHALEMMAEVLRNPEPMEANLATYIPGL